MLFRNNIYIIIAHDHFSEGQCAQSKHCAFRSPNLIESIDLLVLTATKLLSVRKPFPHCAVFCAYSGCAKCQRALQFVQVLVKNNISGKRIFVLLLSTVSHRNGLKEHNFLLSLLCVFLRYPNMTYGIILSKVYV